MSRDEQARATEDTSESRRTVRLDWKGPFQLHDLVGGLPQAGNKCPGVYLWTLPLAGELEIAYVGQASDIRDRMYQHVFWTLGGAYYLYETDYLREGRIGRGNEGVVYTPGLEGLMNSYLLRLGDLQQVAVENLRCYRYFWAEVRSWSGAASQDRRQVESALISRARTESPCLQNGSLSSAPIPRNVLTVKSEFGESGGVRALYSPIVYLADRPATS